MASDTLHLVIASVGQTSFDGPVVSTTMPGVSGMMTILPHHEPLVSMLKKGVITVRKNANESQEFSIDGGVVEISGNKATVLL